MPYGYCGRILHVDLTEGSMTVEEPRERFYRLYMGGKGFAGYYLNGLVPGDADPLGPDNVLVFATGVVGGTAGPGMNRFTVAAKSPLTGGWGESEAGGWWAPELKFAGFDAIVIKGRAATPVYLWIHDGQAELKPARHLWGLETAASQAAIREELGDRRVRVAQTGPAGENLVRYACVVNELKHFNGRTGMGAVMGSKNLKAIAVRGHDKVPVHDQQRLASLAREFALQVTKKPSTNVLRLQGTPGLTAGLNAAGMLPTRNFTSGSFEGAPQIEFANYEQYQTGTGTCYACPIRCKREVAVSDERFSLDHGYGGPEYETVASFGSNCGIADLPAILKANELCSRYTLDTISTGMAIAFAMECFEKGLLTEADTGGLKLKYGNAEAMLQLIELIAHREGIGDLLADGVKRAAERIGRGAADCALQVKGLEIPMHEPRGKYVVGIGYALSDTGADHLMTPHDTSFNLRESVSLQELSPLGISEPVELFDLGWRKARLYCYTEGIYTLWKVLGVCLFVYAPRTWQPLNTFLEMFQAITGWDSSWWELMKVAERASAMSRLFNVRCGFGPADDRLPERFFQPLEGGKLAGHGLPREEFRTALELVYQMKGWDPATARPTTTKLLELDLDWLIEG
jgi:aldehyde:ferredoxin oxidoreductase